MFRFAVGSFVAGLWGAGLLAGGTAAATPADTGRLEPYVFDNIIIVWKSVKDLESATEVIASGKLKDGDLDPYVECFAEPGDSVSVLGRESDGKLLKVHLKREDCEGIVFSEEFHE